MNKFYATLLNILMTVFVTVVLLFAFLNFSSSPEKKGLFGYKGYTVLSNSMKPTFDAGDYIIDQATPYQQLKKGDIISYLHSSKAIVTHRISSISAEGIKVQGDQNEHEDDALITRKNYLGEYNYRIPKLGTVTQKLSHPVILITICVIIAIFLLLLYFKK